MQKEAIDWSVNDRPSRTEVARSRNIACEQESQRSQCTGNASEKSSVTRDDILKVVSEQGKAIRELPSAVEESLTWKEKSYNGGRPRPQTSFPSSVN